MKLSTAASEAVKAASDFFTKLGPPPHTLLVQAKGRTYIFVPAPPSAGLGNGPAYAVPLPMCVRLQNWVKLPILGPLTE